MTREEAIQIVEKIFDVYDEIHECSDGDDGYKEMPALRMAIEALRREEAEEKGWCHRIRPKNVEVVVRCKDCRHRYEEGDCTHYYWCRLNDRPIDDTDFCAWGERKGGEEQC